MSDPLSFCLLKFLWRMSNVIQKHRKIEYSESYTDEFWWRNSFRKKLSHISTEDTRKWLFSYLWRIIQIITIQNFRSIHQAVSELEHFKFYFIHSSKSPNLMTHLGKTVQVSDKIGRFTTLPSDLKNHITYNFEILVLLHI